MERKAERQHDLKIGVAGLGGAAGMVLPYIEKTEGFALAGAADVRPEARALFEKRYLRPAFASVADLCRSGGIDILWIETPNHLHCEHALTAAQFGKHIICAKPLATTLAECDRMIEAAERAGVLLLQGHSKIFDPPVRAMREVVAGGRLGRAVQVNILLFNDWLQRPRLAEELDAGKGGGLVLRQGPHLADIASYIVGEAPRSVRAITGSWDPNFDTAGNFSALLAYPGGAAVTIAMSGYGYFDSSELHWGIGPMGAKRDFGGPSGEGRPRRAAVMSPREKYAAPPDAAAEARRRQGEHAPFFGLTIVSCERGVVRQSPGGLFIYDETGRQELALPPYRGRAAELIEMREALVAGRPAFPDGRWARKTLETCLAIQRSSQLGREVDLATR